MNVLQKSIQKVQKDLRSSQIWIPQEALLMGNCLFSECPYWYHVCIFPGPVCPMEILEEDD